MKQKNIFTGIAILMVLQGVGVFFMSAQIAADSFPDLSPEGIRAASEMATVAAAIIFCLGLVTFASRENPKVVPAYIAGFGLFTLNTARHLFLADVGVPLPLFVLQVLILIAFILVYLQNRKLA